MPFPDDLSGAVIKGVDVQILAADTLRIADYFAKHQELSEIQSAVLKENTKDLELILPALTGYPLEYFLKIKNLISELTSKTL